MRARITCLVAATIVLLLGPAPKLDAFDLPTGGQIHLKNGETPLLGPKQGLTIDPDTLAHLFSQGHDDVLKPGSGPPPAPTQPTQTPSQPRSPKLVGPGDQAVPGASAPSNQASSPAVSAVPAIPAFAPAVGPSLDPALLVVGIVYLGAGNGDVEICSGTLVDATHVLTAGHCGCGNPASYRIYTTDSVYPPGNTNIMQGGLGGRYYTSKPPVMFDPRLCGNGPYGGNDLALLELAEIALQAPTMNFGNSLWALLQQLTKGQRLLVVGYGYNNQNAIGLRNEDSIPIMSVACTERAVVSYCKPYAEMILAEAAGPGQRNDTCGGDSGGAVFQQLPNEGYALLAVTSRATPGIQDNPLKNCGGGGIYTILGRNVVQQWLKANGVQPAPWLKIGSQ